MILDGKKLAAEILARVSARAVSLAHPPLVVALVGEESAATKSYLKIKQARAADAGCVLEVRPLGSSFDDADAALAQLPLPESVDVQSVLDSIPRAKDADVLSDAARTAFELSEPGALLPPVVGAVVEILKGVPLAGRRAAVVGNGFLVGAPVATWLRQQGAAVTVLDIDSKPEDFIAALRAADVVVSGAGKANLITPELIKEGVVLIDAGTSESGGVVVGDANPACAAKCSLFTPVPGGVGPIAVAKLFENAVELASRRTVA